MRSNLGRNIEKWILVFDAGTGLLKLITFVKDACGSIILNIMKTTMFILSQAFSITFLVKKKTK